MTRLLFLVIAAAVLSACGGEAATQSPSETRTKIAKPSDAECYTTHDCVNVGAFKLYTHCGVVSALVNGNRWMATPPLLNAEQTGPPEGWGNPFTAGTFRRLSPTKGEFISDTGHTARFALAPAGWKPPACD